MSEVAIYYLPSGEAIETPAPGIPGLTYQPDHAGDAESRLLVQFNNAEKLHALVRALVKPMQQLELDAFAVQDAFDVDEATGDQLTILGNLVGEPRQSRTDIAHRAYVKARILANDSNGTPGTLYAIARALLGGSAPAPSVGMVAYSVMEPFALVDGDQLGIDTVDGFTLATVHTAQFADIGAATAAELAAALGVATGCIITAQGGRLVFETTEPIGTASLIFGYSIATPLGLIYGPAPSGLTLKIVPTYPAGFDFEITTVSGLQFPWDLDEYEVPSDMVAKALADALLLATSAGVGFTLYYQYSAYAFEFASGDAEEDDAPRGFADDDELDAGGTFIGAEDRS